MTSGHNMKKCSSCHIYKDLKEFNKNKNSKDGLYHRCRSCHGIYNRLWRNKNIARCIKQSKEWKINNKDKVNKNRREYSSKRYYNDINFRLTCSLRNRMNRAIKNEYKSGSAISDLGCSVEYLKKYLESQFQPSMSWNNYGCGEDRWNIDHIRPLSWFNLTDRKQFIKACNYSNMKPMWSIENSRKCARSRRF